MPLLVREQWIARPIDEVFAFFCDAHNLEAITPPWLKFNVLSADPLPIQRGTLIRYRLRWRGLPIRWLTEISAWEPPFRFIDQQLRGAYRRWHHTHTFTASAGGTLMRDEVDYEVGWGLFGMMATALLVQRDVEAIFDYRRNVIADYFETEHLEALEPR